MSVCMSVCVRLSVCLCVCLCVCLSVCMSVWTRWSRKYCLVYYTWKCSSSKMIRISGSGFNHLIYSKILHYWEIGQNMRRPEMCVIRKTCVMTSRSVCDIHNFLNRKPIYNCSAQCRSIAWPILLYSCMHCFVYTSVIYLQLAAGCGVNSGQGAACNRLRPVSGSLCQRLHASVHSVVVQE